MAKFSLDYIVTLNIASDDFTSFIYKEWNCSSKSWHFIGKEKKFHLQVTSINGLQTKKRQATVKQKKANIQY